MAWYLVKHRDNFTFTLCLVMCFGSWFVNSPAALVYAVVLVFADCIFSKGRKMPPQSYLVPYDVLTILILN